MEELRRGLRVLVYAARWIGSQSRIAYYRSLYSGLSVGKGVSIGRGVYLSVIRGATLLLEDGVRIDSHAYLVSEGSLSVGKRTYVGVGATIVAKERIEIGMDGLIAAYATIRDQDHRFDGVVKTYSQQGLEATPVTVGDNVWIGTKATILRGVHIGPNAIIGANAVVTKAVKADSVAVGIPARTVKSLAR